MKQLIASLLLALGIAAVGFTSSADAQVKRDGVRTGDRGVSDGGTVLNDDGVLSMLRSLGYEPKIFDVGGKMFHISTDKDGFHYEMSVRLSPNGRKLWIYNRFATRSYSADEMRRLMEASAAWGPAHFVFDAAANELSLRLAVDNHGITQDWLRTEIDFYMQAVRQTESLWNPGRF